MTQAPSPITPAVFAAADTARTTFLRDIDANDQIGALWAALEAAFGATKVEGGGASTAPRHIVCQEWQRAVKEFNLLPGSPVETVITRILDRLDGNTP